MAEPLPKKEKPLHNYAIYSNMVIEMAVIIAVGVFGGIKLDAWLKVSPLFTVVLSLAGVAVAMYVVIRTMLPKKPSKHESEDTH